MSLRSDVFDRPVRILRVKLLLVVGVGHVALPSFVRLLLRPCAVFRVGFYCIHEVASFSEGTNRIRTTTDLRFRACDSLHLEL